MTAHVGMLHTVPALASRMDADLRVAVDGPVRLTHVVDAELLDGAVRNGVDAETLRRTRAHLQHLEAEGARTILVTCSSIGEVTDEAAIGVGVPVVRVDRAMAAHAAALASAPGAGAGGITVLATLEATLGPTSRLLAAELSAVPGDTAVAAQLVEGAAEARARGDQPAHDRLVAEAAAQAVADGAAVVVLAQASMATAVPDDLGDVPVLTSPAWAVGATVRAAGLTRQAAR
ncbi:aspartate/glutamate racemase family protein [Isoptericola sp. NPDC056618]|uniref:aspartate/glutamate racemase family protein n=1 Tax=Isoptericola sp. NPDC056618 TaxID=3345878 RepID=UPI0036C699DD